MTPIGGQGGEERAAVCPVAAAISYLCMYSVTPTGGKGGEERAAVCPGAAAISYLCTL